MTEMDFRLKMMAVIIAVVLLCIFLAWRLRKRGKNRKLLKELRDLSTVFAIYNDWQKAGLIHWQVKDRNLLIEEQLALVELKRGEKEFHHFLDCAAMWQNYQLLQDAYEQQRINVEAQAVRDADKELGKVLTATDIQRIRLQARSNMQAIDPKNLKGLIREFDIMVIRATAKSESQATQENGQLLAVGHYDGEKLEMAMYEDVKSVLTSSSDSDKQGKEA